MARARKEPAPIPFAEAVRLRLLAARSEREWTREDVAALARSHGLAWDQNTVKNIEAGTREVSVEELLVVLLMFGTSAAEYFGEGSPPLALSASQAVEPEELARILAGTIRRDAPQTGQAQGRVRLRSSATGAQDASATAGNVVVTVTTPGAITWTGQTVVVRTFPQADKKAADALDVSVEDLQAAATRAWGHSLTDERDQRLRERVGERQITPRSRQALRGHITRELLEELREAGVPARRRPRVRKKGR